MEWHQSLSVCGTLTILFCLKFLLFSEREGREKERDRNIDWLPLVHPPLGTRPATQACALTVNRSGALLVHRLALNPPSHTSQGTVTILNIPPPALRS